MESNSLPDQETADFEEMRRLEEEEEDGRCGGSGKGEEGGGGGSVGVLAGSAGRRTGGSQWRGSPPCRSNLERGMPGGKGGEGVKGGRRREEGTGGRECSSSLVESKRMSLGSSDGSGRECPAGRDGSWARREPGRPGSRAESPQLRLGLAGAGMTGKAWMHGSRYSLGNSEADVATTPSLFSLLPLHFFALMVLHCCACSSSRCRTSRSLVARW